jgi:hypothetical protein
MLSLPISAMNGENRSRRNPMLKRITPSPAMAVAMLALLVALSGTAVAAGVVPLAKRALTADNAKKLGGQSAAQVVATASAHAIDSDHLQGKTADELVSTAQTKSVAAFFTLKQGQFSMGSAPSSNKAVNLDLTIPCDAGQKAISGGFQYSQAEAFIVESGPTADGKSWHMQIENYSTADGAFGNTYVICVT